MNYRLSGEKLVETEEDRLEQRTDAFDALVIGMNFYGCEGGASGVGMGMLKG